MKSNIQSPQLSIQSKHLSMTIDNLERALRLARDLTWDAEGERDYSNDDHSAVYILMKLGVIELNDQNLGRVKVSS